MPPRPTSDSTSYAPMRPLTAPACSSRASHSATTFIAGVSAKPPADSCAAISDSTSLRSSVSAPQASSRNVRRSGRGNSSAA
jgi:hypothetical protein